MKQAKKGDLYVTLRDIGSYPVSMVEGTIFEASEDGTDNSVPYPNMEYDVIGAADSAVRRASRLEKIMYKRGWRNNSHSLNAPLLPYFLVDIGNDLSTHDRRHALADICKELGFKDLNAGHGYLGYNWKGKPINHYIEPASFQGMVFDTILQFIDYVFDYWFIPNGVKPVEIKDPHYEKGDIVVLTQDVFDMDKGFTFEVEKIMTEGVPKVCYSTYEITYQHIRKASRLEEKARYVSPPVEPDTSKDFCVYLEDNAEHSKFWKYCRDNHIPLNSWPGKGRHHGVKNGKPHTAGGWWGQQGMNYYKHVQNFLDDRPDVRYGNGPLKIWPDFSIELILNSDVLKYRELCKKYRVPYSDTYSNSRPWLGISNGSHGSFHEHWGWKVDNLETLEDLFKVRFKKVEDFKTLEESADSSMIKITWSDSESPGVVGTKIFRDGIEIGDVKTGQEYFKDFTAKKGVTHKYELKPYFKEDSMVDIAEHCVYLGDFEDWSEYAKICKKQGIKYCSWHGPELWHGKLDGEDNWQDYRFGIAHTRFFGSEDFEKYFKEELKEFPEEGYCMSMDIPLTNFVRKFTGSRERPKSKQFKGIVWKKGKGYWFVKTYSSHTEYTLEQLNKFIKPLKTTENENVHREISRTKKRRHDRVRQPPSRRKPTPITERLTRFEERFEQGKKRLGESLRGKRTKLSGNTRGSGSD